ncbi:MAG: type II secretion system protein, partial [Burkholderiales bacterium]|nr:type II secretion system protein [Burkholderiales bacterium]
MNSKSLLDQCMYPAALSLHCARRRSHSSRLTPHASLRPRRGRRGFTLIEMLVVMLIMGLLVGLVATITRPDDRALLRIEAERLAQL